jgi:hypothetical protein
MFLYLFKYTSLLPAYIVLLMEKFLIRIGKYVIGLFQRAILEFDSKYTGKSLKSRQDSRH